MKENGELFSPETLRLYDGLFCDHIAPYFGERTAVSDREVREFLERKKEEGFSDSTVYIMLRLLRRVLEYGAALGECTAPEWSLETGEPAAKQVAVILSEEQQKRLERFLTENPGPKHLCMFLMLTLGIGVDEVLDLKWADVSFKNNYISVKAAGRKSLFRRIPTGEREKIYLRKMASVPDAYLCTGKRKPLLPSGLRSRLGRIVQELLLPPVRLSDLRRTYAVRCLESGVSYRELAARLGVVDVRKLREYYTDLLPQEVLEEREKEYLGSGQAKRQDSNMNSSGRGGRKSVQGLPGADSRQEIDDVRQRIEAKKAELQFTLDNLEFDLGIINSLRNADGVQGQAREGLYRFIEKALGPKDKDGQYLVEYLRSNMRVASMPLRINNVTTVQAIRRRVAHGFEKLCRRIDELNALEDKILSASSEPSSRE